MEWLQSSFIGPGSGRVMDNLKKVAEKFGDQKCETLVEKLLPIASEPV